MAMNVTTTYTNDTTAEMNITCDAADLAPIKEHVLKELAGRVGSVPGFRKGKAPLAMVEKQLDPSLVQSEFIEHAINSMFMAAADQEKLRAVAQPNVELKKFVPYDTLEFIATLEVIGEIKLGDYKKVAVTPKKVTVSAKDVDEVLEQLQERQAKHNEVKRAAKDGDRVTIDFKGTDAKTKEPIAGADGTEYPLVIGSNTFIPGFEPELVGLKAGDEKSFDIVFPKDYGSKELQSKKVTFAITIHKVEASELPKLDDAFAAATGPFKTLVELKKDVKDQLTKERESEATREYENELITAIADKTTVAIPKSVVEEQLDRLEQEEKQNLMYQGQTWEEHLKAEGQTAEEHREKNWAPAELRVKAGLVLAEIAEKENIVVTPEELEVQIQLLKGQYTDEKMHAEIDKPENRRDITSRILTQKTLEKLREYNKK
jgi:trigger factor